ncbi:MAG TPA: hypothetical protein VIM37_01910 [Candidatus Microsaccharimonas sp.]|jgi:hypothetical protein
MSNHESPKIPTVLGRHGIKVPKFETFLDAKTHLVTKRSFRDWAEALVDANDPLPRDVYGRTASYDKQLILPADGDYPFTLIHSTALEYQPQITRRGTNTLEDDWQDMHGVSRGRGRTPRGQIDEFIIATPPLKLSRSMTTFVLSRYENSGEARFGGKELLYFQGKPVETTPATVSKIAEATIRLLGVTR